MNIFDLWVVSYIQTIRTPWATDFFTVVSNLFDFSLVSICLAILIAVLIYMIRGRAYAFSFSIAMVVGAVSAWVLKNLFDIPRPQFALMEVFGQSFPSYHATIATIFFVMLMYVFDNHLSGVTRVLFNIFCILGICIVAFSRVYLGVHWVSDIAGGILLGLIISTISTNLFRQS